MTTPPPSPTLDSSPLARIGRSALHAAGYLGGTASVALKALQRDQAEGSADDRVSAQLAWIFALGFPFVTLVHVGIGSFLAMQSYFGGTFAEGTGAVVGVGLLRNLSSLLAGLSLAALVAARMVPELRARTRAARLTPVPEIDPPGFLARTAAGQTVRRDSGRPPEAAVSGRGVSSRLIAATLAGPVLGIWGAAVGTLVGWQVARVMMGVSTHTFFRMFWDMLWMRDVLGLVVKGVLFGAFAGIFSCHEGLRGRDDDGLNEVSQAASRAACFTAVGILIVNSGWFILFYHAGPAFGPTLLEPPVL